MFAHGLLGWLENGFHGKHPLRQGKFDAILVLGGGATTSFREYTHVNTAGDRLVLAARLYQGGHTETLVCAGQLGEWRDPRDLDPGEESQRVLQGLGVPPTAILRIEGRNTKEEIQAASELMAQQRWDRVGLLTSAWHLRRALRHANQHALRVEPLPADFRGGVPRWQDWTLIPTAAALAETQTAMHELLGMLVGR